MQAVSFQIVTFIAMSNHAAIRRIKKISTFLAAPSRMVLLDKPPSSVFGDFPANPQRRPVAPSKNKKKKADLVTTKNYRIRAAIKTDAKGELGHYTRTRTRGGPYSNSTGALFMLNGGQVPAYRDSGNRKDIKVWKTLSVPQMVGNDKVQEGYMTRLELETGKLLDKYYDMCVK